MTEKEIAEAKKKLPCEYLRYYGKPRELLTVDEIILGGYRKQKEIDAEREAAHRKLIQENTYPELKNEDEARNFIYLRACVFLKTKPVGSYEGNEKICADVLKAGEGILEMFDKGMDAQYALCLSNRFLNIELQKEIVEAHIPF